MSIKIIGLDLDGTTLGINGKLPPINKIAIERAIASYSPSSSFLMRVSMLL